MTHHYNCPQLWTKILWFQVTCHPIQDRKLENRRESRDAQTYHYKDPLPSSREFLKLFQCLIAFSNPAKYCILKKVCLSKCISIHLRSDHKIKKLQWYLASIIRYLAIKMRSISKKHWKRRWGTVGIRIPTSKQSIM